MISINIGSLNVRGLRDKTKRNEMFTWLKNKNLSIIFLQETHCTNELEDVWRTGWGHKVFFSNKSSHSGGVCILLDKSLQYDVISCHPDPLGRYILLHIKTSNRELLLCNVYAPNKDEPQFFSSLFQKINTYNDIDIIIGGDFNLVQDVVVDKSGGRPTTNQNAQDVLKQKQNEFDLIDIRRLMHPTSSQYTWRRRSPVIKCRLDYFLVSSQLVNVTKETDIKPGFRTDHSLITINILENNQNRGRGFWKLNTSLLIDNTYTDKIKKSIR